MLTITLEMPVRSPNLDCETGCLNDPQVFPSLHEFRLGCRFKLRTVPAVATASGTNFEARS
jgi:hypothetical protein